jgi:hypothetical protein
MAEFWVGERCSVCVEAWSTWLECLMHLEYELAMAQHNTSISPYSPTGRRRHTLHGYTTTCLFVSMGLCLMLRHGLGA